MKQTIDIPEGYETVGLQQERILQDETGLVFFNIKKKNIKNFDFYIDEYLRTDECTTNDMLCNWMTSFEIDRLKDNLKQNKLQFVPWEVKVGLFKFICKDLGITFLSVLHGEIPSESKLYTLLPSNFTVNLINDL